LWLFNGHLQTIYCALGDFSKVDRIQYRRTYLRLADGGTLGLDFADSPETKPDTPVIVVQHGLTGGSYEQYVRAILHPACTPVEEGGLGYRAVVVNSRGCAGVPITTPQFYSAGHTDDIRQALMYISHSYPNAPLLGLGYSLGANVITRYMAEEGEKSRLSSGCALACPWNLEANSNGLMNSFLGKHMYQKALGGNLQRLLKRHAKFLLLDPDHYISKAVPDIIAHKNPTLIQFDEAFTKVAGGSPPTFPFPNATAYYRWASSHKVLADIRMPYLAINAADDPVVQHVPMDGGENPHVTMVLTGGGGHLGWFQRGEGFMRRWMTAPVLEWMKLTGQEILPHTSPNRAAIKVDEDGYLREEGRPHLGCKPLPGSGVIYRGEGGEGMVQGL
jgi:predicted alpha/beta-fold hydrolase